MANLKATWLGDTDPAAQSITIGGVTFVKGEATTVPDNLSENGMSLLDGIRGNPAFAVSGDADDKDAEVVAAAGEDDALKAKLDEAGVKYPPKASVEVLRGKLPS
jgi:hypothetical protein